MISEERPNIQMDNGQNLYKNRILTYNLQQPVQKLNSEVRFGLVGNPVPITNDSPGSQTITPGMIGPK